MYNWFTLHCKAAILQKIFNLKNKNFCPPKDSIEKIKMQSIRLKEKMFTVMCVCVRERETKVLHPGCIKIYSGIHHAKCWAG